MEKFQDGFTYDFHLASHRQNQVIDKGRTDYKNFVEEFENFPWVEQLEESNRIKRTSPTISVHSGHNSTVLWVSIMGDGNSFDYLIGYNYPKPKKGFFGLGREKQSTVVEMRLCDDKQTVLKCFHLFFKKDSIGLTNELEKLQLY